MTRFLGQLDIKSSTIPAGMYPERNPTVAELFAIPGMCFSHDTSRSPPLPPPKQPLACWRTFVSVSRFQLSQNCERSQISETFQGVSHSKLFNWTHFHLSFHYHKAEKNYIFHCSNVKNEWHYLNCKIVAFLVLSYADLNIIKLFWNECSHNSVKICLIVITIMLWCKKSKYNVHTHTHCFTPGNCEFLDLQKNLILIYSLFPHGNKKNSHKDKNLGTLCPDNLGFTRTTHKHTYMQKLYRLRVLGSVRLFKFFWKNYLVLIKTTFIWSKHL